MLMGPFKVASMTFYNKADSKLQKVSKTIGAITVIIIAATAVCSWVSSQFQSVVSAQISDFRDESKASDVKHEQATTRLELMMLIEHDPTNKVAIEKMAKYYFVELGGDLYITEKYSGWAAQYGGDISFVIGKD